ncbi:hypothetical protein O8C76_10380 [Aliarcobacter butzleri]|uniref:DUF3955 domain-containing protein n=1 Tax=Aliarcobacter butzleri TaxID=28197 RepID=A0AAW7Q0J9_9BACT|nr:hypothetical protein [Aliarcobacter butzleri]MDN5071426.1 hypothetical protein [Aliarcobacter butzleri]
MNNNRIGLYIFSFVILLLVGYIVSELNVTPIIEETENSKAVSLPINWFYFYSFIGFLSLLLSFYFWSIKK